MSGCYEGVPYVLWGSAAGFAKPQMLRDRDGSPMHAGRYWDAETRQHTSGPGPGGRAYSALPLDWDGDGDLDLVVGTDKGDLHLRRNEGTAAQHAFATRLEPLGVSVPGGYAMPVAVDWNHDGRIDLVSGSKDGAVYWFENTGAPGRPALAAPRALVPAGQFRAGPDQRAQVAVCDYDDDGALDLLVGDYSSSSGRHGYVWLFRQIPARDRTADR